MLDALRFVQGAIQKNGVTPELEHYIIKEGRVTGFNGYMALSAPIALEIEAVPKALTFFKALSACGDTVVIKKTDAGHLHIESAGFKVFVPCLETAIYEPAPTGDRFPAPPGMAKAFARMLPFVGEDASRPWAMGLCIGNGAYTATNNVILLQLWDGHQLPTINCPRFAVAEVARLKEDPVEISVSPSSITFFYEGGRWLRSQVIAQEWPFDKMSAILDRPSAPTPIPDGFFEAVDRLAPFTTEGPSSPVFLMNGSLSTVAPGAEIGASVEVPGLREASAFRLKALQLLSEELRTVDFSVSPALFFGDNSRGAIIGMEF